MNNRVKVILFAVLVMIVIAGANKILKMQNNNYISSGDTNNISSSDQNILKVGSENFDEEVLRSDKKVLIDFYATWCGPCKVLSPTVEEIAKENDDIKVVKIDVDEEEELANKYGVISIPTLIVIENGEVINKSVGVISKEEIESMLQLVY